MVCGQIMTSLELQTQGSEFYLRFTGGREVSSRGNNVSVQSEPGSHTQEMGFPDRPSFS